MNATQTKEKTMTERGKAREAVKAIQRAIRQLRKEGKFPRGDITGQLRLKGFPCLTRFEVLDRANPKRLRVKGGVVGVLSEMFKALEKAGELTKGTLEVWSNHRAYRCNFDFAVDLG